MDCYLEKRANGFWCVVQSKPTKELFALRQLSNQGFEVYFPTLSKQIKRGRKYVVVDRPLFPRYLFVWIEANASPWRSLNGTLGVSSVVMMGGSPGRLPDGFVEALQLRLSEKVSDNSANDFKVGARVRVLGGPFDDLCGEVVSVDKTARVTILLDMLARQVPVTLNGGKLISAA